MKIVELEQTSLNTCINEARRERIVVTRQGKPVALIIGIDEEQLELGRDYNKIPKLTKFF